ncbi:hypothetical protein [Stackebrandtia nassauensis]|uniref:Uncharacterized protein n=1 Tax=Stackebrandtia nassauensis (strain DSM 44728 / CIP 108903 / NRRL B-16338 / NBRC 102104 / LLR-40K-21) TaxID=446470 RepID=D3PYF6_STANL|nr:hypothetical protein [Stackebrandtia nassauensis]ADD41523.1 hypothetical protein Snas_1827 [Stackebrandtia nassauensis DSM 44728]
MTDRESLGREIQRVASGVAYWSPARWRSPAPGGGDRVGAMTALIQTLADVTAVAEDRPPRPVPRLPHDTALPDQLKVVAADLVAVDPGPEAVSQVEAALARARSVLF